MRDRSSMPPELVFFPTDERTLEERYRDVRAERDDLEVKVHDLSELVIDILTGRVNVEDVASRMSRRPNQRTTRRALERHTSPSIVYYVEMSGRVKIGFSTAFVSRMQAFYARPEQVLAIEPGDSLTEAVRHRQFAVTRIEGSELFDHSAELDQHLADLCAIYPDPYSSGCKLTNAAA